MTPRRRRLAGLPIAGFVLAALAVLLAAPAFADDGASLSGVSRGKDGTITGVLTVRGGQTSAADISALTLVVDGRDVPVATQPGASIQRTTMLVVDTSGSMSASDMATVRSAVEQFLQRAPADVKVGVVSFANKATVNVAPTLDRNAVRTAVSQLKAKGDTSLYDAVSLAADALGSTGDRSIVLLSDGADNKSSASKDYAIQRLSSGGIRAEVIGFKTGYSDNSVLGQFASAGGGSVAAADDGAAVDGAFTAAARALDSQVIWSAKPPDSVNGKQDIVLKGVAKGASFSAGTSFDFGPAPAPSATATTAPTTPTPTSTTSPAVVAAPAPAQGLETDGLLTSKVAGLPMPVAVAALALFIGILLLVLTLVSPAFKSQRRERVEAIEQYVNQTSRRAVESVRTTNVSGIAQQLVQLGDRVVDGRQSTPETVQLLQRADLPWRAGEWAVLRVVSVVVGVMVGFVLLHGNVLAAIVGIMAGAVAGVLLPPAILRFLARRRARKFERQLPDVLMLVASSLSTGFSLPQALDAVAHDVAEPAAKEFSRAMAETRIGADIEDALERMADRMDSSNMRWTSMAIEIQRKVGGNLAETLRQTATTLREREALFRHVRALSAEGRLSAYILIGLPIAILLWMLMVNSDYISLLWKRPLGLLLSVAALILMAIGVAWMRKVVEVKV